MLKLNFTSLFILAISLSIKIFPQVETEFTAELFRMFFRGNILVVENNDGTEIYTKPFLNPFPYLSDLDSDGVNEFLVNDSNDDSTEFILSIYSLLDTFYLTAEINSGITEPYQTASGEIEGLIIVTGNNDFSYLNEGNKFNAVPINCWKYEEGELLNVNEELYEIFIFENENLLAMMEAEEINNCSESQQYKSLIAAVYINYCNAGEKASAGLFMETSYKCDDYEKFKSELDFLYKKGNSDEI